MQYRVSRAIHVQRRINRCRVENYLCDESRRSSCDAYRCRVYIYNSISQYTYTISYIYLYMYIVRKVDNIIMRGVGRYPLLCIGCM